MSERSSNPVILAMKMSRFLLLSVGMTAGRKIFEDETQIPVTTHCSPSYANGLLNEANETCHEYTDIVAFLRGKNNPSYLCSQLQQLQMGTNSATGCTKSLKSLSGLTFCRGGQSAYFSIQAACGTTNTCADFLKAQTCPSTMAPQNLNIQCGNNCNTATCCRFKKDECQLGTANCASSATCTNTDSSFTCSCNDGYKGDGVTCSDINECSGLSKCSPNAVCNNTVGSYTCTCRAGYTGDGLTCNDIDECPKKPCDQNAACSNTAGSFSCSCNSGYQGTGLKCDPLPCSASTPPQNGVTGTCNNYLSSGATCQPLCSPGYTVSGQSSCKNGNLTEAICIPNSCDASASPTNARIGNCSASLSSGSTCTPSCNNGYAVVGVSSCSMGVLTSASCQPYPCSMSNSPAFGTIGTCSLVPSGSTCQIQCNEGFSASGVSTCRSGILSSASCRPSACSLNSTVRNGNVGSCSSVDHGASCQITCNAGFEPSGISYCSLGKFLDQASCVPKSCQLETPPVNGRAGSCASVTNGSSCLIACNPGFSVSGFSTCSLGSLSPSTCIANMCSVQAPVNGTVGNCPHLLSSGASCQPECNDGHIPSGPLTCNGGTLTLATCLPSPCQVVAPENGGMGSCPRVLAHGASCQASCGSGYVATGSVVCTLGQLSLPLCIPTGCNVQSPVNGLLGTCPPSLPSGSSCQPSCNQGYSLSGLSSCNAGIFTPATCNPSSCTAQPPANGVLGNCPEQLAHGASCQPSCLQGYTLAGTSSCSFGILKSAICSASSCSVQVPSNGALGNCPTSLASGSSCFPSCNPGYTLSGPTYCQLGTPSTSTCSPSSCSLDSPNNGGVGNCQVQIPHGSVCQPTCNQGYTIVGQTSCNAGTLNAASCQPSPCAFQAPTNGGAGNCPDALSNGGSCKPTCSHGYTLSGPTSCSLGLLSSATCNPSSCPSQAPPNGVLGQCPTKLAHGDSCQPTCNSGYLLTRSMSCSFGSVSSAVCSIAVQANQLYTVYTEVAGTANTAADDNSNIRTLNFPDWQVSLAGNTYGVRMEWPTGWVQFQVPAGYNIFTQTQALSIPITDLQASDNYVPGLSDSSTAQFCHACTKNSYRWGDTCWAVLPSSDVNRACGCTGMDSTSSGIYYGGYKVADSCAGNGGGFTGPLQGGVTKGNNPSVGFKLQVFTGNITASS